MGDTWRLTCREKIRRRGRLSGSRPLVTSVPTGNSFFQELFSRRTFLSWQDLRTRSLGETEAGEGCQSQHLIQRPAKEALGGLGRRRRWVQPHFHAPTPWSGLWFSNGPAREKPRGACCSRAPRGGVAAGSSCHVGDESARHAEPDTPPWAAQSRLLGSGPGVEKGPGNQYFNKFRPISEVTLRQVIYGQTEKS